jgi:hypothetical protein
MTGIPTNTKKTENPYKKEVFETYISWKSVPAFMRKYDTTVLAERLGIEEVALIELIAIRTQTEFAQKYDVEPSTLSNWNKLIEKRDILPDMRQWAKKLTRNVLWSLYKTIMEKGDANSILLWLKLIEGWTENNNPKSSYHGVAEIRYELAS